jgi:hypothetical protein
MTSQLDGNAMAGQLEALLGGGFSAAAGTCAGCGRTAPLAEAELFTGGPGSVLRCRGCGQVLLRVAEVVRTAWLDLRGLAVLRVPLPEA